MNLNATLAAHSSTGHAVRRWILDGGECPVVETPILPDFCKPPGPGTIAAGAGLFWKPSLPDT